MPTKKKETPQHYFFSPLEEKKEHPLYKRAD